MRELRYSILLIISLFCTLILFCPGRIHTIIIFGSCGIILTVLFLHYRDLVFNWRCRSRKRCNVKLLLISIVITIVFLIEFIFAWLPSRKLRAISSALNIPHHILVCTFGIIFAIGTVVFIHEALLLLRNTRFNPGLDSFLTVFQESENSNPARLTESWQEKGFIFLCAVVSITLCSCSSPLYPMNDWVDVNAFFTVGKGMFKGLVPYRDLFDHKGPYLFLLYGLASLVSSDSLFGGYLLEIVAAYVYLLYSYRIACLHLKKRTIILVPLMALISFTSKAFIRGGSPEELCLAFTAYSLWLFLRDYLNHDLRPLHFLLLGIIIGWVFWTKFTLTGIYIGWYIWMCLTMIQDREGKALVTRTTLMFCGFVLSTVPWVIYFGVHGAIKDWLEVYLYDNLFAYSSLQWYPKAYFFLLAATSLSTGLKTALTNNPATMVLSIFFTVNMLQKRNGRLEILYALTVLSTLTAIFIGGRSYIYYSLPMNVFLAPSLALVFSFTFGKWRLRQMQSRTPIWVILVLLVIFLLTPNRSYMHCKKEDLAQYQFRKIITENSSNATLLNYGELDQGFYTVCDILPNCRAFYIANVLTKELMKEQSIYVNKGLCDYIVTCAEIHSFDNQNTYDSAPDSASNYDMTRRAENRFDLYTLIAEGTGTSNGVRSTYRLYQLKSLTK